MPKRRHYHQLVGAFIDTSHSLDAMWGGCRIGLIVVEAYLHPAARSDGWISAKQVAARDQTSPDTARRQLENLASVGRLDTKVIGGRKFYRADDSYARRTIELINELFTHDRNLRSARPS